MQSGTASGKRGAWPSAKPISANSPPSISVVHAQNRQKQHRGSGMLAFGEGRVAAFVAAFSQ